MVSKWFPCPWGFSFSFKWVSTCQLIFANHGNAWKVPARFGLRYRFDLAGPNLRIIGKQIDTSQTSQSTVFMEVCQIWYAGTSMRQHAIYVVNSHGLFRHVVKDEWLRMPMWVSPSKPPKVFIHASISFTRPAQLQFITLFNPHHGSAQSDKFDIIWCFCSGHTCWKRMKTQGEGIDCQEYVVPEEGVRFDFSQCNSHPSAAVLGKSRAQSTLVVWWKNINPMMLLMDKIKLTSSVEMVKTLCRWIP